MKTKVIEFIPIIGDGGAETLVKNYALILNKEKFDIKVVTLYPNNTRTKTANFKILKENGIEVLSCMPCYTVLNRLINKILPGYFFIKLIKKLNPDVIHVHMGLLQRLSVNSKKLRGIKLFYTLHSVPSYYFGAKHVAEENAAKVLIKKNNLRLIALHNQMASELNSMFDINNTIVLNNGIDFSRFSNLTESKECIRSYLGFTSNDFIIGHNGRFTEAKNHSFLLDVFAEALKLNPQVKLLLIGSGELELDVRTKLKNLNIEKQTTILSNRTDIPYLLKAMDVFVFPSKFEGLSLALLEAQVSGLRCLVSNKIDKSNFLTVKTIPLSIDDSPKIWANEILYPSMDGIVNGNIDDYNMESVVCNLEKLYLE